MMNISDNSIRLFKITTSNNIYLDSFQRETRSGCNVATSSDRILTPA